MIIAELCQNHLGNKQILSEMVAQAAKYGARFCKIQTFFAQDLAEPWKGEYQRIKGLELSWEDHEFFVKTCRQHNVVPMTSVYTSRYLKVLSDLGFRYVKIGSAQNQDIDTIKDYIATGFKVIVSTGGTNIKTMQKIGPLAGILHCNSLYPTNPYETNMERMIELKRHFPGVSYGYSSHVNPTSFKWYVPLFLASYLGATYIEVHFTILGREQTKDGAVSLNANQLSVLSNYDGLSEQGKLQLTPEFGLFRFQQSTKERDLIDRYRKRWKVI